MINAIITKNMRLRSSLNEPPERLLANCCAEGPATADLYYLATGGFDCGAGTPGDRNAIVDADFSFELTRQDDFCLARLRRHQVAFHQCFQIDIVQPRGLDFAEANLG